MKLLAFDTSSRSLSVEVRDGARRLSGADSVPFERHASALMPAIQRALKDAGLKPSALDVIAVGTGPGSFTGLRVGMAAAKTLAFCLQKKLIGVSSFDALALACPKDGDVVVLSDARRQNVYAARYKKKGTEIRPVEKPQVRTVSEALRRSPAGSSFVGEGAVLHARLLAEAGHAPALADTAYPSAGHIAELAWRAAKRKRFSDLAKLEPMYLYPRDCNVTPPRKRPVGSR